MSHFIIETRALMPGEYEAYLWVVGACVAAFGVGWLLLHCLTIWHDVLDAGMPVKPKRRW